MIDEFRIYSYERSEEQIAQSYRLSVSASVPDVTDGDAGGGGEDDDERDGKGRRRTAVCSNTW